MLKKTISYKDWDGNPVTEDFYFNLTEAELMELELSEDGEGFGETIKKAIQKESGKVVLDAFKRLITLSIGKRVGNRFVKSDEVKSEFMETGAYSALFMELATNADAGAAFVKGLFPSDLAEKVEQQELIEKMKTLTAEQAARDSAALTDEAPAATPEWPTAEPTTPGPEADVPESDVPSPEPTPELTDVELANMTVDQFMAYKQSRGLI
jgi:hypothetical protein